MDMSEYLVISQESCQIFSLLFKAQDHCDTKCISKSNILTSYLFAKRKDQKISKENFPVYILAQVLKSSFKHNES